MKCDRCLMKFKLTVYPIGSTAASMRSCVPEVVWKLARLESFECAPDPMIERRNCPFLGLTQMRFYLREALLDRIEIGTVGRQIAQCGTRRCNDLAHRVSLMGG